MNNRHSQSRRVQRVQSSRGLRQCGHREGSGSAVSTPTATPGFGPVGCAMKKSVRQAGLAAAGGILARDGAVALTAPITPYKKSSAYQAAQKRSTHKVPLTRGLAAISHACCNPIEVPADVPPRIYRTGSGAKNDIAKTSVLSMKTKKYWMQTPPCLE